MNSIGIKSNPRPKWKKLLYLKQPYPDNYTDESFLTQLKRNEKIIDVSYKQLVLDFLLVVFHVNNLVLVILIFAGIYHFSWDPIIPVVVSSILSIIAGSYWEIRLNPTSGHKFNSVKQFSLVVFVVSILSPVLKSLTRSTSSDSIWFLSCLLTVANILFHDYAMSIPHYYKPIISTNLSLSNALVLSSRLTSTFQVFSFIFISIQISILLPLFDFSLRKLSSTKHNVVFVALLMVVYLLFWQLCDVRLLALWVAAQVFIMFILPGYFMFLQRYKNELLGPWDIAKPVIRST